MHRIIEEDMENIFGRDIPWSKLEGKTILLTGAYGMLASYIVYLVAYLNQNKGMHVKLIAVVRSAARFAAKFKDLRTDDFLELCVSDLDEPVRIRGEVDYIIHAASLASPQYYATSPVEVLKPNVIGNYHLLNLAEEKQVKGYLLFSTGDIYGAPVNTALITEEDYGVIDPLAVHSCYNESKRMAETMCMAWFRQKKVPVKIARIWHTYAPTMEVEKDPRVFASFVRDIVQGNDIEMKSSGSAKRSFCYVADAIAAYFMILLRGQAGEAYNVCNTRDFCSISDLADRLALLYTGQGIRVIRSERSKDDVYVENKDAAEAAPDNTKICKLGWQPFYTIESGFSRVVEYVKETGGQEEK